MGPVSALLRIEVCYSPGPGEVECCRLELPEGATLWQAVEASGLLLRHPELAQEPGMGIWGRRQPADARLRDRDRVELYRPLKVDPKEARRQRYRGQRQQRPLNGSRS
jgi:putative ubiquitin-RnfH superfamily antitoxin RatB of RatAB toxin-antitoxin module